MSKPLTDSQPLPVDAEAIRARARGPSFPRTIRARLLAIGTLGAAPVAAALLALVVARPAAGPDAAAAAALAAVAFAAFAVAAWRLAVRIARPIERLREGVMRLAAGDLDFRVAPGGAGELTLLAREFNRMADRIADQSRALAASERRWQFALEGAGDGAWDWHVPGDRVFYSRRWQAMLGHSEGEVGDGRAEWDRRLHPEDRAAVYEALTAHLAGRTAAYASEHRMRTADGGWRWVLDRGVVVDRDADGRPLRVIGTLADVTARRRADQALREAERRWQFALDGAGAGVFDWDLRAGTAYRSPRLVQMLGDASAAGAGVFAWGARVHLDDLGDATLQLHRHLNGASPVFEHEHRVRGARGEWVWATTRALVVERAPDGAPLRMIGTLVDVSARKRGELELQASESRYRSLVEVSPDGVLLLRDGRIAYANDAAARILRSGTPAQLVGRKYVELFADRDRSEVAARLATLEREPGPERAVERQVVAADGAAVDVEVRGASFCAGGTTYVQAVVRDVTARKAMHRKVLQLNAELERRVAERTAELAAANRELEAFTYSVAHDLRAPLRAIDGFTRLVEQAIGAGLAPEPRRHLDRVHANIARMAELIEDLLDYARIGQRAFAPGPTDTAALARAALAELAPGYPRAVVALGELPTVHADATLLARVFANLMANALKFSSRVPEPRIEVGSTRAHGEHVFYVRDNGVGFSMDYAHNLFGVFQRLHDSAEYEGTGVGLAIVQRALARHGGRAWAFGEPGAGATFSFALPERSDSASDGGGN